MAAVLRLADLLAGLSLVADLGFGYPPEQSVRSCLIATALARRLGLPEREVAAVFYTALLQHVGCVGYAHETALAFGDERATNVALAKTNYADPEDMVATFLPEVTRGRTPRERSRAAAFLTTSGESFGRGYATAACEVGRETARRLALPDGVQRGLYHIDEWWNGNGAPQRLRGEEIALAGRITRVSEVGAFFDRMGGREGAVGEARRRAGGLLDPGLVDLFATHAGPLLDDVNARDPREAVLEGEPKPAISIPEEGLGDVAVAFADLADLKCPAFHGHSRAVAALALEAGRKLRFDTGTLRCLEVAALLHDLGRVGVSSAVWARAGPLTAGQWEQVRLHPYHSERILAASEALRSMATIAGMHHERLDGSGYHRGSKDRDIVPATRVLAAADAFQAMIRTRPHRDALTAPEAARRLTDEGRAGRLDEAAISAVLDAVGHAGKGARRQPRPAGLSDREVEVLRLVAEGCSNQAIAERLFVSRRTAEHHVQHIYTKVGVSSRAAAALFAMEHGLLG